MKKGGLGRGLEALISNIDDNELEVTELKINEVEPNINQPRKSFDDEKLFELTESVKKLGVIQPIIVKRDKGVYRIVAGERRWRAARIAGFSSIPVIIKDLSEKQEMEIALVENLQREDLNPIEEAEALKRLIEHHGITQEELSSTIGKSRSAVANSIRLLNLTKEIKNHVIDGSLSSGHARAILSVEDTQLQKLIADEIIKNELNVRQTEKLVKIYSSKNKEIRAIKTNQESEEYTEVEERLKNIFGTKVKLISNSKKSKIVIECYSKDELDGILEKIIELEKYFT